MGKLHNRSVHLISIFFFYLDLGISDCHEVVVADITSPKPITIVVKFTYGMEQ